MTVSACESTEQESAKIGREGQKLVAGPGALKLGAANRSVRVSAVTLLKSEGRTAVAAKLTSSSSRAQLDVPLLLDVTGKGAKLIYSNSGGGAEASLQQVALLRPGQSAWWVDDQVLTSQAPVAAKLQVGTGRSTRSSPGGAITTTTARTSVQGGVSVLSASLVNHSRTAQSKVAVFAVALKGGRVVAAGRAVVAALAGRPGASAPFQVFLVGNPAGAKIELSAVPTAG